MKRLKLSVLLFAALGCGALHAQTILKANIPFDFQLAGATMPAGEYRIEQLSGLLRWHCFAARKGAFVLTSPVSSEDVRHEGRLQFTRYGDTYFFARFWMPNSTTGAEVPKSHREKELARRMGTAEPLGVALSAGR
jgi:hypothetical protein